MKNGKGKPKSKAQQPHLIQQITGIKPAKEETQQEQEVIECKYGIFCAHLRMAGACSYPHRRHHYLLLNLVPPANHLEDLEEAEEEVKLSKRQRKEKKIIQKTISQHIDVEALTKQEQLNKLNAQAQIKQQFLQNMNEIEKQVADVVTAETAEQYFEKLNTILENNETVNMFELKKRSMVQLKKKSEKTYADIIDKEYRIANRLIKESGKNTKNTTLEIYEDINHNTIPSVRQYFERYLQPHQGVLQQNSKEKHHLATILHSIFFREVNQFKYQYYLVHHKSSLSDIISNIEFYNMMIPYLHSQGQPFNKYLLIDCQEDLSLTTASQLLAKDYTLTFHIKCKPAPDYPFGQLPANLEKFAQWATKTSNKYRQTNKEANVILVLNNIQQLFNNPNAQQFEQEKLRERRETFRRMLKIFNSLVYFLTPTGSPEQKKAISELLELEKESNTKYERKLYLLQQK